MADGSTPIIAAPTPPPVANIPGSIVKAICTIQTAVEAVKKSQRNQHGGYMFASTDDIYAAVTRKMGEVGLAVICLEDEPPEIKRVETEGKDGKKTAQWGKFTYSFVLATEDATWTDPRCRRTLLLQLTGPQTFQAAQSYAEKSFFRSLFKLPTGDMDLDGMPQADTVEDQEALAGNGRKRKSSYAAKKDGVTTDVFNEIRGKIAEARAAEWLSQVRTIYADEWATMPPKWVEVLDQDYEDKMGSFAEA